MRLLHRKILYPTTMNFLHRNSFVVTCLVAFPLAVCPPSAHAQTASTKSKKQNKITALLASSPSRFESLFGPGEISLLSGEGGVPVAGFNYQNKKSLSHFAPSLEGIEVIFKGKKVDDLRSIKRGATTSKLVNALRKKNPSMNLRHLELYFKAGSTLDNIMKQLNVAKFTAKETKNEGDFMTTPLDLGISGFTVEFNIGKEEGVVKTYLDIREESRS